MTSRLEPSPLFDTIKHFEQTNSDINQRITAITLEGVDDAGLLYELAIDWLLEQKHSENNFKTHRSELTTFLIWCWHVEQLKVEQVDRRLLTRYLDFCQSPPPEWIAYRNVAQFKGKEERLPNRDWRPFLGKTDNGIPQPYRLSASAIKTKLALLSAFFNYLIEMDYSERNPAASLLRSGRFKGNARHSGVPEDDEQMKSFTDLQWSYVMQYAQQSAAQNIADFARSRFLVTLLYSCYLRISEVAARPGFSPVMGQFRRDSKTGVWGFFVPLSKGGKSRTVALSDEMLDALKQYRTELGLPELPAPRDSTPLFVRHKAAGRGREQGVRHANLGVRQLRDLVDAVISGGADLAMTDGFDQDAREMRQLSAHSLRHTGISHDINLQRRPLSHVQADAGHDSIDTTSKYLHTSRVERHQTAKSKPLDHLN
ncbi:tyrosine-type recombinase/integrase [Ferrimonas lipolytica]|uniref:Site-specific integrase n=1 Tax=Ferrimonas lipolytica TaxID=2724191 RepID=A0A6H1UED6_9GAMM|nr:site-specific integrase [Ferrimonas lipolytica]QIZ76576.1 site-specific integrase [Ferrimonas lipolytica]